MKFSMKETKFCFQIRRNMCIWSHLLKKSLMKNFVSLWMQTSLIEITNFKKYIYLSINVSVFRIVVFVIRNDFHCMKSVQIRSFSGPYFPLFGLNTEIYSANLLIQSEFREIKTLYLDTFYAMFSNIALLWNIVSFLENNQNYCY